MDEKDHILGAHILAHHAEEIINIFALAIRLNLTIDDVKSIIFTYPTLIYGINYMLQLMAPWPGFEPGPQA